MTRIAAVIVAGWCILAARAEAGSYVEVAHCDPDLGCTNGRTVSTESQVSGCETDPNDPDNHCLINPFGIVHPYGYHGIETALEIRVCVDADDPELIPAVERAIASWNAAVPSTENCHRCFLAEEQPLPPGPDFVFVDAVILHELGHCALGLDHVNRRWLPAQGGEMFPHTSFTRSANVRVDPPGIDDPDGIRGNRDDFHTGLPPGTPPADSVSWFRRQENDPFIVDGTTIDLATYSRSLSNLPAGDRWGASANRLVGESLGYSNSQSVMYSLLASGTYFTALGADDVNMIKLAQTGEDSMSQGGDGDDYTVTLTYVGDCSLDHEIRVHLSPFVEPGDLGQCLLHRVDYTFDPPGNPLLARHYSLVRKPPPPDPPVPFEIELNDAVEWEFGGPIFWAAFETGDLSEWDAVVAAPGDLTPEEEALELELMEKDETWLEEIEAEALLEDPVE